MPWFKVDDNLAFHHKTVAAGNAAMGLWVRAGSWCANQLTDGFVPEHMLAALGRPSEAARLVQVGLWHESDGGWRFHEWNADGRQPTREAVLAEREAARERMAQRRKRSREVRANTGRTNAEVREVFGDPDPTRPDPTVVPTELLPHSSSPPPPEPPAPSADADAEFDAWWSAYPRKVGKGDARAKYRKARRLVSADTLRSALIAQTTALTARGVEYCPHPATWLNQGRWADDPPTFAPAPRNGAAPLGRVGQHMALVRQLAEQETGGER